MYAASALKSGSPQGHIKIGAALGEVSESTAPIPRPKRERKRRGHISAQTVIYRKSANSVAVTISTQLWWSGHKRTNLRKRPKIRLPGRSCTFSNAMTAAAFTRFSDDASRRGAFVERAVADPLNRAGIDWVGPDLTKRVGARSGPSLMGSKRRRF